MNEVSVRERVGGGRSVATISFSPVREGVVLWSIIGWGGVMPVVVVGVPLVVMVTAAPLSLGVSSKVSEGRDL